MPKNAPWFQKTPKVWHFATLATLSEIEDFGGNGPAGEILSGREPRKVGSDYSESVKKLRRRFHHRDTEAQRKKRNVWKQTISHVIFSLFLCVSAPLCLILSQLLAPWATLFRPFWG